MKVELVKYTEKKPRYLLRIVWLLINTTVFKIVPWVTRRTLVRCFGSKQGYDATFYPSVRIFAPWNLQTGEHVVLGSNVELYNKGMVTIGNNVVISRDVFFCTASHDITSPTMDLVVRPIVIGDNVWIAAKSMILPGVTIGKGAVVGAGTVVAKDVPPWSIVVGNPARVVSERRIRDGV